MKPFYIILLVLWFALAYFLCANHLCEQSPPVVKTEAAVIEPASENSDDCVAALMFKDNDFKIVSKENFKFNYSL